MSVYLFCMASIVLVTPPPEVDPADSQRILLEVRKAVAEQMEVTEDRIGADTTFADLGAGELDAFSVSEKLGLVFEIPYGGFDDWETLSMKGVAEVIADDLTSKALKSAGRKILERHLKNPALRKMTSKELAEAAFLTSIERNVIKRKEVSRYTFKPTRGKDFHFRFEYPAGFFSYDIYRTPRKPLDRSIEDPKQKSVDLDADKRLMWQTSPMNRPNAHSSTREAIWAASRVFNTVELVGKTTEEIVALLGDPKRSNNSMYNFPFWPTSRGALVYRFDTGAYGWQFDVHLDKNGKAARVVRRWIH